MERKLPKNIRQIGNVSDNPKVYVEDYVDTFINQMCEKATDIPVGAFLIGESFSQDGQDYMFIHGAVQMKDIHMKNNEVVLGVQTWKKACEEGKKYFKGNTILGWILIAPDMRLKLNPNLEKLHEQLFMKKNRLFVMKNTTDKEETFFVYKYSDLMEIGGHYIYYEKNPCMQDYMIASRKQNCVTPSETFEDRATQDFRSMIKKQKTQKKPTHKHRFSYMASTILLLLVAGIGVVTMNEYSEMQGLQNSVSQVLSQWIGSDLEGDIDTSDENPIEIEVMDEEALQADNPKELEADETLDLEVVPEDLDIVSNDSEAENNVENLVESELGNNVENQVEGEPENNVENQVEGELENNVDIGQGDEGASLSNVYIVKEGDTLAQISKEEYGTVNRVGDICTLNELKDSNYIYVGQELLLPY